MRVIDVDSHFLEPLDWLDQVDPELGELIPPQSALEGRGQQLVGDLLAGLPPAQRPDPKDLMPPPLRELFESLEGLPNDEVVKRLEASPAARTAPGGTGGVERLAAMDEQGIDVQFLYPTSAFFAINTVRRKQPELLTRALTAYNTWAAKACQADTSRMIPVAYLEFKDPTWALAEMERMRERGSRAFIFPANPVEGRSLGHRDFDPIWARAAELGMVGIIHIGGGRPHLEPGWVATEAPDIRTMMAMGITHNYLVPETALTAMIMTGVFERHPELRIIVAEFGVDWFPLWVRRLEQVATGFMQAMPPGLSMKPAEYVRRNVRITPLPGQSAAELIRQVGSECVLFSSDYPHPEGSADAVDQFRRDLDGKVDGSASTAFFGGNIAEVLAL